MSEPTRRVRLSVVDNGPGVAGTVVELDETDQLMVSCLEDTLAKAKAGELDGLIIVQIAAGDGYVQRTKLLKEGQGYRALGALAVCSADLANDIGSMSDTIPFPDPTPTP